MAKGDTTTGVKSAAGTGIPKQDQYSVMHALMDSLSPSNGGVMPRSPDQGQMGMTPNSNQFGGNVPQINYGAQPNNPMGGRFGTMAGVTAGGVGGLAPSNPQEMMRRTMMNKGSFGGT